MNLNDNQARNSPPTGVRFLTDADGQDWTIWEVKPRLLPKTTSVALPPLSSDLQNGWLTFQSQTERRRVAPAPPDWQKLPDAELLRVLAGAQPLRHHGRSIE